MDEKTGIVKFFNLHKGYGFIRETTKNNGPWLRNKYTGKEIFVHFASIVSNESFRQLKNGDKVTYKIKMNTKYKKEQAVNVKISETS